MAEFNNTSIPREVVVQEIEWITGNNIRICCKETLHVVRASSKFVRIYFIMLNADFFI